MSLIPASSCEYLEGVTPSVLPTKKHLPLRRGRWPNMSACHAVRLWESSASLFLHLSMYDRMRWPLPSRRRTASPHPRALACCWHLWFGLMAASWFPGHRTPRESREGQTFPSYELLFLTDDRSSQHNPRQQEFSVVCCTAAHPEPYALPRWPFPIR